MIRPRRIPQSWRRSPLGWKFRTWCPRFIKREKLIEYGSCKKGAKLGGIIYLHDISAARFTGTASQNLQMFRSMCGEGDLDNILLGTTKWDLNVPDSCLRHKQLVAEYWKPLLDKGAKAFRMTNTAASAWELIDRIISPGTKQSAKRDILILCVSFSCP